MSYDLAFWKQKPTCTALPSHIYGELLDGRAVEDLEAIPTAEFIKRLHQQFSDITTDGGLTFYPSFPSCTWECTDRGSGTASAGNSHEVLSVRPKHEAQLRRQARSQVQLGNEGKKGWQRGVFGTFIVVTAIFIIILGVGLFAAHQ